MRGNPPKATVKHLGPWLYILMYIRAFVDLTPGLQLSFATGLGADLAEFEAPEPEASGRFGLIGGQGGNGGFPKLGAPFWGSP